MNMVGIYFIISGKTCGQSTLAHFGKIKEMAAYT